MSLNARSCAWLGLALLLLGRPALAGAPYVVDDGYLSPDRGCQLETWFQFAPSLQQYNVFPACQVAPNVDLTLAATFVRPTGSPGATDVTLQYKRVNWSGGDLDSALALGVVIRPDTQPGDRLLRNAYLYGTLSQGIANKLLVMHYNLGWQYDQTAASPRHLLTWGIRARVTPAPRVDLAAEFFGDSQQPPTYQAGVRVWLMPDHVRLLTAVGQQLTGEFFWTVGLALYSDAFL